MNVIDSVMLKLEEFGEMYENNSNNNNNRYEHVPKSIETSQGSKVTILWNQQVQTDRTIPQNNP